MNRHSEFHNLFSQSVKLLSIVYCYHLYLRYKGESQSLNYLFGVQNKTINRYISCM